MQRGELLFGLILVVGLGLLVYGQFFMLRPGAYLYVADEPTGQDELVSDTAAVEYDNLSPAVQRKFERRLDGKTTYLGSESDADRAFPGDRGDSTYVHYRGDYYETRVTLRHPTAIPRALVISLGGAVTAVGVVGLGGLRLYEG